MTASNYLDLSQLLVSIGVGESDAGDVLICLLYY